MTRSSEHPEPELYLNTNSKYCLAEIIHLGETSGRMQIGHYESIPNTFASVDKKSKAWILQLSLPGRGSAGRAVQPQTRRVLLDRGVLWLWPQWQPVVAYQQLWQLAEQLDIIRQWFWLERSSTPAYAKPETSNLHIMGTNRNGVTALT